jgi:acetylornithine deacetylase/succinyl-diaminopimelate desuccinylase-like protein
VRADYVVTEAGGFQMPSPRGPRLPVIVGEKGSYWCRITVRGTPGHASQPFRTDNALVTAAEIVKRLAEYRPPTQIHDTWRRFIEGVDFGPEWNANLLNEETLADFCEELPIGLARQAHACTHTTFAPTVIHGGTKTNVIPDVVELEVDIRTLPGQRSSDISAMLEDALGDLIACTEITPFDENESTSSPTDTPLWDAMGRVSSRLVEGSALVPFLTVGATDARFFPPDGFGRVRLRAVQPQAVVRRLRLDVPRQRRTRRHRIARPVDPPLGRSRPRHPGLTPGSSSGGRYSSGWSRR